MQYDKKLELENEKESQKQKKIVFHQPKAGHDVSIQKLADESVEVIIGLEHRFLFSKTELLLVEDLRENRCLDLRN